MPHRHGPRDLRRASSGVTGLLLLYLAVGAASYGVVAIQSTFSDDWSIRPDWTWVFLELWLVWRVWRARGHVAWAVLVTLNILPAVLLLLVGLPDVVWLLLLICLLAQLGLLFSPAVRAHIRLRPTLHQSTDGLKIRP